MRGEKGDWGEMQEAWDVEIERPFPVWEMGEGIWAGELGEEADRWIREKAQDDVRRLTS